MLQFVLQLNEMDTNQSPAPSEPKKFVLPERNPVTHAAHRREMLLQVTMPLVIAILILLAGVFGVIYSATQGPDDISRWADISLVWLLAPALIGAVTLFAVLVAVTYGLAKLLGVFPGYARLVQDYFLLAQVRARQVSDRLVEPVLKMRSRQAGAQRGREATREQWEDFKSKARW